MADNYSAIILAAGDGTRMKSEKPKVLHEICGKPMISILVDTLYEFGIDDIVVVTGYKENLIKAELGNRVSYITQKELLGTGHAVLQTIEYFSKKRGKVVVLCGDAPLISKDSLGGIMNTSSKPGIDAAVVTMKMENPAGYGRIIKDSIGKVIKIVEEKDSTEDEKKIKEINTGMYCFNIADLFSSLDKVSNNNVQREYYLTDVIDILNKNNKKVIPIILKDSFSGIGINSRVDLAVAEKYLQKRITERIIKSGVTIIDPDLVYIEEDVEIGIDTVIEPFVKISRGARIGANCVIGSFVYIKKNEIVGNNEVRLQQC